MKKQFLLLLVIGILFSCDDGELIVTEFTFENKNLQGCTDFEGNDSQVFFNISNEQVSEAIALIFEQRDLEPGFLLNQEGRLEIPLNAENEVVYRTFDTEVDKNYFCNEIPPIAPDVTEEFRSTSGGMIVITSEIENNEDHDNDEVPSLIEQEVPADFSVDGFPDTDGDEIPNYLDIDDDNDNVLTSIEIEVDTEVFADDYPDTDADGIPNYLDPDDDNDGTISRFEDWDLNGTPDNDVNDERLEYYLNPEIDQVFEVNTFLPNTFNRSYRYFIDIEDLTLENQGGDGEKIRLANYEFGFIDSPVFSVTLPEVEEEQEE